MTYYRISKNEKILFFGKKIAQVWAVTLSIEVKSVDPEQTAPIGAVRSGSTRFAIEASKTFQQTRKADDFVAIGALRVNECVVGIITSEADPNLRTLGVPLSCLTASRLVASILRVVSCFLLRSISPSSRLNIVILSMNFVG